MGVGIIAIELYCPNNFVDLRDLETADACEGKYTLGLGQSQMGVCDAREDSQSLAMTAMQRLLARTGTLPEDIGRIDLGTESLLDASKSHTTILQDLLGTNFGVEGVTSINACYGGAAALFNATAWVQSDAWDGRKAIVIASDIAKYARGPARATSGAGAVAMLIGPDAPLVLEPRRKSAASNVYDFWKPDGLGAFPRVDAKLSQQCYQEAFQRCTSALDLASFPYFACHAPYAKLVRKTLGPEHAGRAALGITARTGNMYTASIGACILEAQEKAALGDRILCFSFGSGYKATAFVLRKEADFATRQDWAAMLDARSQISVADMHSAMDDGVRVLASSYAVPADAYTRDGKGGYATGLVHEDAACAVVAKRAEAGIGSDVPHKGIDYSLVTGRCAENVVGYVPVPLGVAGPLLVNGRSVRIPMATTEGCLIASTSRGAKAISLSGGAAAQVLRKRMTRAPVLKCASLGSALEVRSWILSEDGLAELRATVRTTSRFAELAAATPTVVGSLLFVRIACTCGDAMGMNMLGKAAEAIVESLVSRFAVRCVSISGNMCCDKKAAAINWTDGRGCETVCEARLPGSVVKDVLHTSPAQMVEVHISKNLVGSAMAGALGGSNAQSANVVAAVFVACGQDAAQIGTSSMCMTHMYEQEGDLVVSCTMPGIEVGVVGGGTHLPPQKECLAQLGSDSCEVAESICAAVLAAEVSLLAALSTHTLMQAHLKMNRK